MRPYLHALSSSKKFGADWQSSLTIHEFVDSSKFCHPDIRHRLALHSVDFGAAIVRQSFPHDAFAEAITRQHVQEDLGVERTLSEWFDHCNIDRLPKMRSSDFRGLMDEAVYLDSKLSSVPFESVQKVSQIIELPLQFSGTHGHASISVAANAFGLSLIRKILGPPTLLQGTNGEQVIFDPTYSAERIIYCLYGSIPNFSSIATTLRTSFQGIRNNDSE